MITDIRGLNEECGIFGIWNHKDAAHIAYYGLHSLQHRGQDGAGIVIRSDTELNRHRGMGLVNEIFSKEILDGLVGNAAVAHVRYAIVGRKDISNVQPFLFRFQDHQQSLALCHNGNLTNATTLRTELEAEGRIFQTSSDSEILAHLIKKQGKPTQDLQEKMMIALNQVKGGFAYLLMTANGMMAARDPNGFRPLSIARLGDSYVFSSETCAFDIIGATFLRDVEPGELVMVNNDGLTSVMYAQEVNPAICSMEFIYFARPDSSIAGVNVHTARKESGRILAKEAPVDADVVVAVPDSSLSATVGYAEASGIPFEMGLVKNRYVGRTFIQPSQELRELGVKMKLSAVSSIVAGKSVILVDDSIVRGTTSKRIVQLLKDAGAREVHFRVASPPIKYPCFYGIDMQTTDQLIAHDKSVEEIRQIIGADSLAFLSEQGLMDAINLPYDNPHRGLCMAYFNGNYPTDLYDYEGYHEL